MTERVRTVVIIDHVHKHATRFPPVVWRRQVAWIVTSIVPGVSNHHVVCDGARRLLNRGGGVDIQLQSSRYSDRTSGQSSVSKAHPRNQRVVKTVRREAQEGQEIDKRKQGRSESLTVEPSLSPVRVMANENTRCPRITPSGYATHQGCASSVIQQRWHAACSSRK
jgi:hypothetical protein